MGAAAFYVGFTVLGLLGGFGTFAGLMFWPEVYDGWCAFLRRRADLPATVQKVYYRGWNACRLVPAAFLFSRAAAPASRILAAANVKPNVVTLAAGLTGAVAVACAAFGRWIPAGLALVAFQLLDHCDGQVARLTNRRTALGGYLDTVTDYLVDLAFLGAVTAWGILHDPRVGLLGMFALVAYGGHELLVRHSKDTVIREALRARDFTSVDGHLTVKGPSFSPVIPHRDLNTIVLAAGLLTGLVAWSLAALTVWWAAWGLGRIAWDLDFPKNTRGVLARITHEDNH